MADRTQALEKPIRGVAAADKVEWLRLWAEYCAFYRTDVPAAATETTWSRLMDPASAVHGLVFEADRVVGFAHYVLHPYTWGPAPVCYLEDLYVAPEARGRGAGRSLIEALLAQARDQGWARVYWMTEENNVAARALYDRFTPRDSFVRYVIRLGD